MKQKRTVIAAAAGGIGVATALAYQAWPQVPLDVAGLGPLPPLSPMKAYKDAEAPVVAAPSVTPPDSLPPADMPPVALVSVTSLKAAYEQATGDKATPTQRVWAYELVERCLEAGKYPALAFEKALRCGDAHNGGLEQGQIAGRIDSLRKAAEAGAHRAWYKLQAEADGYFSAGMLPNTPEMQAELDRLAAIAIENGDPRAIQTVLPALVASTKPEHAAKALELQVAVLFGLAREFGERPPLDPLSNGLARQLADRLKNPEQVAEAVRAGERLAAKAAKQS